MSIEPTHRNPFRISRFGEVGCFILPQVRKLLRGILNSSTIKINVAQICPLLDNLQGFKYLTEILKYFLSITMMRVI